MKSFLKDILILLLVLIVTVPISLSFIIYHQQLRAIKKEVKQVLIANTPESDLVAFSFELESASYSNLKWHHAHEFELDGKMFDIVHADTVGNFVRYVCFPDKQETALNQRFNTMLNDRYATDTNKKHRSEQLGALFMSLYINGFTQLIPYNNSWLIATIPNGNSLITSNYMLVEGPPPKLFI